MARCEAESDDWGSGMDRLGKDVGCEWESADGVEHLTCWSEGSGGFGDELVIQHLGSLE